ncbi:DNA-processing protein DprA [Anaerosalibacter sp. Marseille-P3206]|uniref:DNA-processing protein DprA n=1 Tax=Anaerosalibacter sp. Marseille-P3206 TaxID=1871005 RepID=UPI0009878FCC|nr:DNA-processing protein DprA [Anaerosalibacter sp. Marseille-P3206]
MNGFTNRETLIWLNSIFISNATIKVLLEYFDNIKDIWDVPSVEISKIKGIKEEVKEKILYNRNPEQLKIILEKIDELGINAVTILDENYPNRLRYIHNSPTILYCNGTLVEEDELSISIVGSRKSTSYGKWASEKFSKELASIGVTVVSGMAKGIDTCAHRGALDENGRTIAVLGSGVDVIYPRNNKKLYEDIIKQGVVMSEFPIGTQPFATNFPQRNRIISGISLGVIVIEATEKSGSLITATHALEQGKEVFALPGNINSIFSRGTNSLIKDGAKIVMDIEDILEEIYELKERLCLLKNEEIDYSDLSPIEIKIVDTLKERPIHCDNIVYLTGLDISTVISTLTILELKGIAKELPGRVYTLS